MLVILEFVIVFVLKSPLAGRDFSVSFSFYSFFFSSQQHPLFTLLNPFLLQRRMKPFLFFFLPRYLEVFFIMPWCCIEESFLIQTLFEATVIVYLCLFTLPDNQEMPLCAYSLYTMNSQELGFWEEKSLEDVDWTRCPGRQPLAGFGQLFLQSDLSSGALCYCSVSHPRHLSCDEYPQPFPRNPFTPPSSKYFCDCPQPCPSITVQAVTMPF